MAVQKPLTITRYLPFSRASRGGVSAAGAAGNWRSSSAAGGWKWRSSNGRPSRAMAAKLRASAGRP